jgi:hypothetical protein
MRSKNTSGGQGSLINKARRRQFVQCAIDELVDRMITPQNSKQSRRTSKGAP